MIYKVLNLYYKHFVVCLGLALTDEKKKEKNVNGGKPEYHENAIHEVAALVKTGR